MKLVYCRTNKSEAFIKLVPFGISFTCSAASTTFSGSSLPSRLSTARLRRLEVTLICAVPLLEVTSVGKHWPWFLGFISMNLLSLISSIFSCCQSWSLLHSFFGLFFFLRLLVLSENPYFQHSHSYFSPAEVVSVQKHNMWAAFLIPCPASVLAGGLRMWPFCLVLVSPKSTNHCTDCREHIPVLCLGVHNLAWPTHIPPLLLPVLAFALELLFSLMGLCQKLFAAIRKAFIHLVMVSDPH